MAVKLFRKCGISIPVLALALALSSISGCIDLGMRSIQASSLQADDEGTQAGIQDGNSTISLDLSFESEIDKSLFRTWGRAILWSKRPLPYLLLNATLLRDGSAISQAKYLLTDVEPLKDYGFEISRLQKADPDGSSYSCLLEATGPDGIIASEKRQCSLKYLPPEPSRQTPSLVRTPEEEWPDYEPLSGDGLEGGGLRDDNSEIDEPQDEKMAASPDDKGDEGGEIYVGSKSSKKYHMADCRYALKLSDKNKVAFDSIEDAEGQGYEPCKVCNPSG